MEAPPSSVLYSHSRDTFSSEFLLKARPLLSLDQRGLMYILQSKVFAHKISYKYGEFFLDHRNIISKKYYNLTIKLVLEVEPSWWDFLKNAFLKHWWLIEAFYGSFQAERVVCRTRFGPHWWCAVGGWGGGP